MPISFVRWCQTPLNSSAILVTAWGRVAVVWVIQGDSQTPVGCIEIPEADFVQNPLMSVSVGELLPSSGDEKECEVSFALFDGTACVWSLTFSHVDNSLVRAVCKAGPFKILSTISLSKPIGHKTFTSESIQGGTCLSGCSTPNDAYDLIVRRTARSIQIFQFMALPQEVTTILERIIDAAASSTRPLTDLALALGQVYVPKPGKISQLDTNDLLRSVINRFTHGESMMDLSRITDEKTGAQLAFGLHSLHTRIDPIAASSKRARCSEKQTLLQYQGIPVNPAIECPLCNEPDCQIDSEFHKAVCRKSPDHSFLICQASMEPLRLETPAVECNFCRSVMKLEPGQTSINTCRICRIGITYPL